MNTVPISGKSSFVTSQSSVMVSSCILFTSSAVFFAPLLYCKSNRNVSAERSILSASYRFMINSLLTVSSSPMTKVCSSLGKIICFPIIEIITSLLFLSIFLYVKLRKGLENKAFSNFHPQSEFTSDEENSVFQGIYADGIAVYPSVFSAKARM